MQILMFGWEFPPHISGGLGTACYGLTKGLSTFNDIGITFVVPFKHGDEDQSSIKLLGANNVELNRLNIKQREKLKGLMAKASYSQISAYITPEQYELLSSGGKGNIENFSLSTPSGKLGFTGKYGSGLFEEIYKYGIVASEIAGNEPHDIIHAHDWLTFNAGIEARKVSGKPMIAHVHATEYDRCGESLNRDVYELERYGMMEADKVITVSNYTRDILLHKYHIKPGKVCTVHNGVAPADTNTWFRKKWGMELKDRIVTYLGRVTYQKGPDYFINAAYKVLQKMDNVRFVMAGTGDLLNEMIKYVARLGISNKFHFTGFLKGDEVWQMYANSDLYVMPSVSEPFGISPLEALQKNIPVIISKQSGVSEVLRHAFKVDFWDIDKMASAIYGVLNYKALSNILKNNGRYEAINLTWENTARKMRRIYDNMLLLKKAG